MYDHGVYGQASSGRLCAFIQSEHKYYFYSTVLIFIGSNFKVVSLSLIQGIVSIVSMFVLI